MKRLHEKLQSEEGAILTDKQATALPRPMRKRATLLSQLNKDGKQEVTVEKELKADSPELSQKA